jgi:hypothetical protein
VSTCTQGTGGRFSRAAPRARTHQPGVEGVDGDHPENTHYVALYVRLAVVRQMHVDAIYAYRHCHKASQNGAENTTQRPRRRAVFASVAHCAPVKHVNTVEKTNATCCGGAVKCTRC